MDNLPQSSHVEIEDLIKGVEIIADEVHGGFTATVPDIPAYGEGDTPAEAIADLKQAMALYIEVRGIERARALQRRQ